MRVIVGIALLATLRANVGWLDRDVEFVPGIVHGGLQTPLLTIRPKDRTISGLPTPVPQYLTAVLIHGISASKSVMIPLGLRLAHDGIECHLLDLPGHGQSNDFFSPSAAEQAIQEVLNSLKGSAPFPDSLQSGKPNRQVVIIGHSLGGSLALRVAHRNPESCVVALSPAAALVTPSSPSRQLLVLGEFDLPTVQKGSAFTFEKASGIPLPSKLTPGFWMTKDGLKKLVVLPWMDHTSTILRKGAFEQIHTWLRNVFPGYLSTQQNRWDEVWLKLGLCVVSLWLVALILDLTVDLFDLLFGPAMCGKPAMQGLKGSASNHFEDLWQTLRINAIQLPPPITGLWSYLLAAFLAVCILFIVNPLKELRLLGGGFMASFLCFSGLSLLVMKRPCGISSGRVWLDLLKVMPAFGFMVYQLGPEFTRSFSHLTLCPQRVWRIPWVFITVFPFFLADEWTSRIECRGLGRLSRWCFHLSSRCTLAIALLFGVFILKNGEFLVVLILPALTGLSILCWLYSGLVYDRTRSLWASAFWSALATGWFVSVFFAQQ